MRKVLIKKWIPADWIEGKEKILQNRIEGTACWSDFIHPGMFHQWGNDYEEFEHGPGNYSVALVELPDGRVEEVLPDNIKFDIEKPEEFEFPFE